MAGIGGAFLEVAVDDAGDGDETVEGGGLSAGKAVEKGLVEHPLDEGGGGLHGAVLDLVAKLEGEEVVEVQSVFGAAAGATIPPSVSVEAFGFLEILLGAVAVAIEVFGLGGVEEKVFVALVVDADGAAVVGGVGEKSLHAFVGFVVGGEEADVGHEVIGVGGGVEADAAEVGHVLEGVDDLAAVVEEIDLVHGGDGGKRSEPSWLQ